MTAGARLLSVLAALAACSVTQAAEFEDQRVFTQGQERARLDRARDGVRLEPIDDEGAVRAVVPEEPPPVPEVKLQGFVRRSDGPPAVWVNDRSTLEGDRVGGSLQVESGRIVGQTVIVRLPDGRRIRLKPGQHYDPDTGRVKDAMQE